jgi:hypothetical protein
MQNQRFLASIMDGRREPDDAAVSSGMIHIYILDVDANKRIIWR